MRSVLMMGGLLLAAWPAARAELVEIEWSAAGQFTHQSSVLAGKFLEVCGKLPAGVKVQWDFEAGAPIDFNVHFHVGKDVIFPTKLLTVARGNDTLVAKIEQDYCWMWTNKSAAPATLVLHLQR